MKACQPTWLGLLVLPLLGGGCAPRCINNVLEEVPDPSGSRVAVLYTRECGATTGPSTNVGVTTRGVGVPPGVGNVLVMKDPISAAESSRTTRLRWHSTDTLEISLVTGRAIQSRVGLINGTTVIYSIHGDSAP